MDLIPAGVGKHGFGGAVVEHAGGAATAPLLHTPSPLHFPFCPFLPILLPFSLSPLATRVFLSLIKALSALSPMLSPVLQCIAVTTTGQTRPLSPVNLLMCSYVSLLFAYIGHWLGRMFCVNRQATTRRRGGDRWRQNVLNERWRGRTAYLPRGLRGWTT